MKSVIPFNIKIELKTADLSIVKAVNIMFDQDLSRLKSNFNDKVSISSLLMETIKLMKKFGQVGPDFLIVCRKSFKNVLHILNIRWN